eukprot:CAMPEP_0172480948 /NCGR_PEP_ID=MMETSP1066-20121228/6479_1 /TAXON_ID=671091 /ORGANISM="Coscinodiscus wailesii, Strain CCMP2513" /LENGTH=339 /DNA_ID=CAMNT_0013242787 /DNA_START=231 /DNA_END=1250 /DNA_ORIENTATION=+
MNEKTNLHYFHSWTIADDELPNLPWDCPLLKTHALIRDVPPSVIVRRISEVMRHLSIAAFFDNKKATVNAETMNNITFKVQLYNDIDQDEGMTGVIVEVQRMSGCAYSFSGIYRSIIRACNGVAMEERHKVLPKLILPTQIDSTLRMQRCDVSNALEAVRALVGKDDIETNLLGMESLVILTDMSKTAKDEVICVAKAIFDDVTIRDRVLMPIMSHDVETKHGSQCILHRYALNVLLNALIVFLSMGRLGDVVRKHGYMGADLVSVLLKHVQRCETKPHDACLSIKCLVALMNVAELKDVAMRCGIQQIMQESHSVGECHHSFLRRESLVLLHALEPVA